MVIYSGGGDKMKRVAEYKDWVFFFSPEQTRVITITFNLSSKLLLVKFMLTRMLCW